MKVSVHNSMVGWGDVFPRGPATFRDVYFTAGYHQAQVLSSDSSEGICFIVGEQEDARLLVPGLKTPVTVPGESCWCPGIFDMQTCNGYGGPLATPDADSLFLERAWAEWRGEAARRGIVAAFFRLHPLIDNARWLPRSAKVVADRQTVFVDLSRGAEAAFRAADSRHRNMVSKGKKEELEVRWNRLEDRDDFEGLYCVIMERLNADASLRFRHEYFLAIWNLPFVELACVRSPSGVLQAGAVFMFGEVWAHYHLSARHSDSPNHLANCILQSAAERAVAQGLRGLHLGGGRTGDPGDSLLKFKQAFGGSLLDFKVALVVADDRTYGALCQRWESVSGRKPVWLLGYRQPLPTQERRYP